MKALTYQLNTTVGQWTNRSVLDVAVGETLSIDLKSGGHWYGHGFNHHQHYPLETGELSNASFAVNNIQSPLWLASEGFAVLADTKSIFDVSINHQGNGKLIIRATTRHVPIRIFHGETLVEAHAAAMNHLGGFMQAPDEELLGDSFFCTWTQYPRCLTQERVIAMARAIRERGYPCSRLIIDDRWESCFGELTFSKDFPDPKKMFADLHELGFKVWLWVTPFVNQEAECFGEWSQRQALIPRRDGRGAAMMRWWGGTAGLVDVTHPMGRALYRGKLKQLQALGADGFKIDGGDYKYQPAADISKWRTFKGESGYSDELLALFEEVAPGQCETRTAWLSQRRNIIWRQGGKDSHWGHDNGLRAMIALGLHMCLMGYDIFIPDMIPDRVQTMASDFPLPTDELMVRWTEASVFMPMPQFSYLPWNYAPETEEVILAYAQLHKALQPYLAQHACGRTKPLHRPIWYDFPAEENLYTVQDEWMLGPDLLIAPVVVAGAEARSVTLPPGTWIDAWSLKSYAGGTIDDHPAPCPGVPVFVREGNEELLKLLHAALEPLSWTRISSGVTSTTYQAGLDRDLSVTG